MQGKRKDLEEWLYLFVVLVIWPLKASPQCNNWTVVAHLIASSSCAGNGSFAVTLAGADTVNLSNIQYGIPLSANGFSIPLNNSPVFNNIPGGTFQVSAVATCGGNYVGRSTSITMPGSYTAPTINIDQIRPTLDCGNYGSIGINVNSGKPPYTLHITSAPGSYTAATAFSFSGPQYTLNGLPSGNYTLQVVDSCSNSTVPVNATIDTLSISTLPIQYNYDFGAINCDTLLVPTPTIINNGNGWAQYAYDSSIKIHAHLNLPASSVVQHLDLAYMKIPIPPGKTLKDCYGLLVTDTLIMPCGPNVVLQQLVPYPGLVAGIDQNCNINFKAALQFTAPVCYPISYYIVNNNSTATYGPYVMNSAASDTTPVLPLGQYTVHYTTADGYTGAGQVTSTTVQGSPYSVSFLNGSNGLDNYIDRFDFHTAISSSSMKKIELFSGPAGYSFVDEWYGGNDYTAYQNQTPAGYGKLEFPAGNYVWRITDNCGSYLLPVTVGESDLYQYTVGISNTKQTCEGMWVYPAGSATNNGHSVPVDFAVLTADGNEWYVNGAWQQYHPGDSFLVTTPGTYILTVSSADYPESVDSTYGFLPYPNAYTKSYTFTYAINNVAVDLDHSQGFVCIGSVPGHGEIYVKGQGGIPFSNPSHYQYYLANLGSGAFGPYIASNTTGIFTNFNGNANDIYDVKIVDSCGAFAVQPIKILDLQHSRLITNSSYTPCTGTSVQLSAIYLPGATYSWTGPGGFTSSLQDPVISNIGLQNAGVYYVTITTQQCMQPIKDSTIVTVNSNPPVPSASLSCGPPKPYLTIINPQATYKYEWGISLNVYGYYIAYTLPSDTLNIKYINVMGNYKPIAIDTISGCFTYGDSLYFPANPNTVLQAGIYSPHLQLCPGDTTILVAQGGPVGGIYQWFLNDVPINGANGTSYMVWQSGNYKVSIKAGPCQIDTSANVAVNVVPLPSATIIASANEICVGDTVLLKADTGIGYTYTWFYNDTTIPGSNSYLIGVGRAGSYKVIISNGGCVATSQPVNIIVDDVGNVSILPGGLQQLCSGDTLHFSSNAGAGDMITWYMDSVSIPGANTNFYQTTLPGTYMVGAKIGVCPEKYSQNVVVTLLPDKIHLGHDTVICQSTPFVIPLFVDSGFSHIIWSTGQTVNSILATYSGTYIVQATDQCGVFEDSIHIYTAESYASNLPHDTLVCNPANAVIFSVSPILDSITWSTGSHTPSLVIDRPGLYWVQGKSPCGVIGDTVNVHFCAPVITGIQLSNDTICAGDCINITATTDNYPQLFYWSFNGTLPDSAFVEDPGTVCYSNAGIYPIQFIVKNAGGTATQSTQLVVLNKPAPRFADTTITIPYKSEITLSPCADALYTSWYLDDSLICSNCSTLNIDAMYYYNVYHCIVSNGNCKDSCIYKLQVVDIPNNVWLPDAFTPNGDGKNDIFHIITDNPNVLVVNLQIYNRWGQLLFISRLNNEGWDGMYHGVPADMGTYFWTLKYKILGTNDDIYFRKGNVQLIR